MYADPFISAPASTVNINVAATSANVKIIDGRGPVSVRIYNDGTATVWVEFGGSSVAATLTTSIPVGPGVCEVQTVRNNGDGPLYVAAIAAGATGKVYFTPGRGI